MNVREGFVEVEGHQLAYLAVNEHLDRPEQPAVVFIHGILVSVNFWRDAVPTSFREGRAWYALSLPAHHPSTVPADFGLGQVDERWLYRLMNGGLERLLGARRAVVVGHSTGGFSALNLAIHGAPSVVGIVSVAGFHRGEWGSAEGMLLKLAGLGEWAKPLFELNMFVARSSGLVQRVFASMLAHDRSAFRKSPLTARMFENTRTNTRGHDAAALFYLLNGISKMDVADHLRDIRVPCCVFFGTHDPVVSAAQSRLISSEVPGATTVALQRIGHMPFMESFDLYSRSLEDALDDIFHRIERDAISENQAADSQRIESAYMKYSKYESDLQVIHQSEVYGAAVFATAARLTRDPQRRSKWLALKALEDQTLARYLEYMKATKQTVTEPVGWDLKGYAEGAALAAVPWRMAMTLVRNATKPFQETFLRLRDSADGPEREFFAYVYAHEKAIEAFANMELADRADSLMPVQGLLE